ncbi:MAG: DUF4352 domain-containing protein, partial [Actinomycetota bacterium]|nr:DUF4352 domain-containing protein [Actinomycetota bacterium]
MSNPPAGWHPDPRQPGQQRYWDGERWTGQSRPAPVAGPGPAQGYAVPPQKKSGVGKGCLIAVAAVVALAVLGGIIAAVAGSGGDDEASSGGNGSDTTEENAEDPSTPGGQEVFAVGETAHTGDLDVTVEAVEDPFAATNQLDTPAPGQRFVGVEMTVVNTGDELQVVSTLLQMEVTDSEGRRSQVALAGTDRPQIGGDVPPGETRRGWVVFGVAGFAQKR